MTHSISKEMSAGSTTHTRRLPLTETQNCGAPSASGFAARTEAESTTCTHLELHVALKCGAARRIQACDPSERRKHHINTNLQVHVAHPNFLPLATAFLYEIIHATQHSPTIVNS